MMSKLANVTLTAVMILVAFGCGCGRDTGEEAGQPGSPSRPPAEVGQDSTQKPPLAGESTAAEPASLRFVLSPFGPPVLFQVDSIKPDGSAHVRVQVPEQWADILAWEGVGPEMIPGLSEGYFVGLTGWPQVGPFAQDLELRDAKVLRVQVTEVEEGGAAWIQVGPAAAEHLKAGDKLYLMRPLGSSTAQLKAVPDVVPLTDARSEGLGMSPRTAARLTQSENHLKEIGLAMHNFHDTHKQFPPAAIFGPDGKPWHSWRVLLLPYLEDMELYRQYQFDEPWDGPNNRLLLDKMPAVFRDPVYGEDQGHFTHYAVVTGPGTAFPAEGAKFDGKNLGTALATRSGATRFADLRDGSSNTLLAGSVSPDRKIPWMKPEDVTFDDTFPAPGQPGSFAAPYKTDTASGGVFLFADGSVTAIRDDIDLQTWQDLLRIADGQPRGDVPDLRTSLARPQLPVIEIRHTDAGPTARLLLETLPAPQHFPPFPLPGEPGAPAPPPDTGPEPVAEEETEVPEILPVRGTVILDGQPVEGATVRFKPRAGGPEAVGVTDASGRFALTTFERNDGAMEGMYRVSVSKKADETRDLVPKKYADPDTSALTVEVQRGPNEFTFELRSD